MNKSKKNNREDFKIPSRFLLIILLLIVYVLYVYIIGWNRALLYYTYFLLFVLFFNISIDNKINTENLSRYHHNKCDDLKLLIEKLKKDYERCICGKNLSSNICKTGSFHYNSKLLNNNSDNNYIQLDNFDDIPTKINKPFPTSN
tara:strand:+ start:1206 stop:1640 length:435 start_codon:yes stop_codon:yes gene_type:complete